MTPQTLRKHCHALAKVDEDIAKALTVIGHPKPRIRSASFDTFFSTIVSQQISTHAASAIMARVNTLVPDLNASTILATKDDQLRTAGMSYRKIEYAKGLAHAIKKGDFNIKGLSKLSDEEAVADIVALRGFGRWSAEIYLMFSLNRKDIFPADDLALRVALGRLKGLKERPTPKQARDLIEHWAPWRTAGSLFLWRYHGATTVLSQGKKTQRCINY